MNSTILLIFLNAGDKKLQHRTINSEKVEKNKFPLPNTVFLSENLKIL